MEAEFIFGKLRLELPRLYAVIDGARDPEALTWLRTAGLPYQCLYAGQKAIDLADEAPYLLHLGGEHSALHALCDHYDGEPTGIFLTSDRAFYDVRRQLRRFLLVKGPDDETMYFRYYDPRIASVFLPTLDEAQIETMFGEVVSSYLYVDDTDASLVAATVHDGGAKVDTRAL